MEKKEYKQPEVKVVEIGNICFDGMSVEGPDGPIGSKEGTFDFDSEE